MSDYSDAPDRAAGNADFDANSNGAANGSTPPARTRGEMPTPSEQHMVPGNDGFVQILGRQWPMIVMVTVASLLLAILYLMVASPVYTSIAKLKVEPLTQQIMTPDSNGSAPGYTGEISSDFLATECDEIISSPVLAVALHEMGDLRTLRGIDKPIDFLKTRVSADVSKRGQTIEVSFDGKYPAEDDKIVAAVVDAYQTFESNHWKSKVKESLDLLEAGKASQRRELDEKTERMMQLAREHGISTSIDPEKDPAQQQVAALSDALTKAHLDTITAKTTYDEAAKSIVGDPDKLQQVAEAEKQSAFSANPQAQLQTIEAELFRLQAQMSDAQRQYLPGHPIIKQYQRRIDQLTISYVAASEQWWEASQAKEESLQQSLATAQKAALDQAASAVEYSRLQADVGEAKKMDEIVAQREKEVGLVSTAGATNITVLDPAQVIGPPSPQKGKTLALGLVLGIIAGVGAGCIRDWMEDRMRTPEAVRNAVGAPVLGSIPIISTAYTAADRGQIVHHDPGSHASESYRTLRTALQFGLPPRTRTILVTSPTAGDGKSTFVSNLAIVMAQAGKRVLIVDGDFRAPMQHRLFGLKDRAGLATVLDGGDQLDQVIQRTEIEGLDVLPCGPIPASPAEMLNHPSFGDSLNELADKYDLVLVDSPPVTAVTDSRIIAACTDATLLVIRPSTSNRKHAMEARDGLKSVGARLVGVALNGVSRSQGFGGATGYYSRSESTAAQVKAARLRSAIKSTIGPPNE